MVTRYEVKLRCHLCGHTYKRVLKSLDQPDPDCPRCKKAARVPRGMDFDGPPPAAIGGNVMVKAIDETARITMEDYKLTDLRSDVRPGETAAPKLPPALQAQADSFFGGGPKGKRVVPFNPAAVRQAALKGAFAQGAVDVVGAVHKARAMPSVRFVAGDGVKGGT